MGELIDFADYRRRKHLARGRCESCAQRAPVAEVLRSDAAAAGLGARLQCHRCLAAELRRGRCGPEAERALRLLGERLRGARLPARLGIEWDVRAQRAVALDGAPLDP